MTETYVVKVKRSARHEWSLSEEMYDENHRMTFGSQDDAECWVDEHNETIPSFGIFFLRDADPEDESGIDAYLVYRKPNLCDDIEDRKTSIMVAAHEPYSGTLFINEAKQELFTFVYAVDNMAVCIAHGKTRCDPKGIMTIDLETFDEYRGSGRFRALDVV
jgi:hypothetical protein